MHDVQVSRAPFARLLALLLLLAACTATGTDDAIELPLRTLNDSGVTGTVTLTPIRDDRTLVRISADAPDHPDMPAHIHPGTCDDLTPQPQHPLENVMGGESETEVAASLDELLADTLALNIHKSNAEMEIYTACVDL